MALLGEGGLPLENGAQPVIARSRLLRRSGGTEKEIELQYGGRSRGQRLLPPSWLSRVADRRRLYAKGTAHTREREQVCVQVFADERVQIRLEGSRTLHSP